MMKNADFENQLRKSLHKTNTAGQWETVAFLARKEAAKRPVRIGFGRLLQKQIGYIGWKIGLAQGLVLLMAVWMMDRLYGRTVWEGPAIMLRLLFCLSALTAMMALPLICRSVRCRMQEIEAAAYFSSVKLLMARLLVLALGDLVLLLGLFLAAAVELPLQAGNVTVSLCLPFLVVSGGSLYMLGHWKAEQFFAGSLGLGCTVILMAAVVPGRFLPDLGGGWAVLCGVLLVFCMGQLRYLAVRSPYAELQT